MGEEWLGRRAVKHLDPTLLIDHAPAVGRALLAFFALCFLAGIASPARGQVCELGDCSVSVAAPVHAEAATTGTEEKAQRATPAAWCTMEDCDAGAALRLVGDPAKRWSVSLLTGAETLGIGAGWSLCPECQANAVVGLGVFSTWEGLAGEEQELSFGVFGRLEF